MTDFSLPVRNKTYTAIPQSEQIGTRMQYYPTFACREDNGPGNTFPGNACCTHSQVLNYKYDNKLYVNDIVRQTCEQVWTEGPGNNCEKKPDVSSMIKLGSEFGSAGCNANAKGTPYNIVQNRLIGDGIGVCLGASGYNNNIFQYNVNFTLSELDPDNTDNSAVWNCFYNAAKFVQDWYPEENYDDPNSVTNPYLAEYQALLMNPQVNPESWEQATYYYNTAIMPLICGATVTVPPSQGTCFNGEQTCNQFIAPGYFGDQCRIWASDPANYAASDTVKDEFCLKNPTAPECKCLARNYNQDFIKLKVNSPDYCWYVPCQDPGNLRTQRDIARTTGGTPENPAGNCSNTCAIIYNFIGNTDVEFSENFYAEISCDFSGLPPIDEEEQEGGTGEEMTFLEQYGELLTYIGIGIAVIVIFILVVVVPIVVVKNKK